VAAWSIASNVLAIVFMFALGLGTAGGVRVANLLAHGELQAARQAGWVAAGLSVVVIGTLGVAVFVLRAPIVAMYTDGPVVVAVTVSTLAVTAFVLVPDALQAVLVGALRGAWDFWAATGLQILAFWVVMVPLGLSLGIFRGGGAPALMTSVGIGVVVAAALLGWRFEHIANRPSPQKTVDSR
jgi:MATE family multidrug resistance protein